MSPESSQRPQGRPAALDATRGPETTHSAVTGRSVATGEASEAHAPTLPAIPTGPIDREPLDYPTPGVFPPAPEREAILRTVLAEAGVELGVYDERIAVWLAQTSDWSTFAVVTSWVRRAAASDLYPVISGVRPCGECQHPQYAHEDGEDPVTPGLCLECEADGSDEARHDYRMTPDKEPQP